MQSLFTENRKVKSRPDAELNESEKKANGSTDGVEEDDGGVPSRGIRGVNVHERIRPPVCDARGVNSPLQEAVRRAPKNEVAEAEPRKPEAVECEFDGEQHQVDRMHVKINESMVQTRGQKYRNE